MIAIASDHGGFHLKQAIIRHFEERGLAYKDFGVFSEESADYPVFAKLAADAVASGECGKGILVCGTGIGISIAANKVKGIRCAHCTECFSAEMSRRHNDANMLALGERVTGPGLALRITDVFLDTGFDGGRHTRRVDLIRDLEDK